MFLVIPVALTATLIGGCAVFMGFPGNEPYPQRAVHAPRVEAQLLQIVKKRWHAETVGEVRVVSDWRVKQNDLTGVPLSRSAKAGATVVESNGCRWARFVFSQPHLGGGTYGAAKFEHMDKRDAGPCNSGEPEADTGRVAGNQPAMEAADSNRHAFVTQVDSGQRIFKKYAQEIDLAAAKYAGLKSTYSNAAKSDPQYPVLKDMHKQALADYESTKKQHAEQREWVQVTAPKPTIADLQRIARENANIAQDLTAQLTTFGRLQVEGTALKARHR